MEARKNSNQSSNIFIIIVILIMLFVLIIFIAKGGLSTAQGVLVSGLVIAFIVSGFLKLKKNLNSATNPLKNVNSQNNLVSSTKAEGSSNDGVSGHSNSVASTELQKTNPWVDMLKKWMDKIPKKQQPLVAVGGGIVIIIVIVLFISLVTGGLFSASPVGTWKLQGYEDRCTYVFYEDGTFVEYDTAFDVEAASYTGHWVKSGSHIDFVEETCPGQPFYDCDTSYWIISGDKMTSGNSVLNKVIE